MGILVQGTYGETNQALLDTVVAEAVLTNISAGDMGIWVGNQTYKRQVDMKNALAICLDALTHIEVITNSDLTAYMLAGGSKDSVIVSDAIAIPAAILETHVAVIISNTFAGGIAARSLITETFFNELMDALKVRHLTQL